MAAPSPDGHAMVESLAELVWPTRCVGCGAPGELLCEACAGSLPWIDQRWACPSCGAPFGWLTCTACEMDWEMRVVCALGYEGAVRNMVRLLKDAHELRLAPMLAEAMARALREAQAPLAETDAICFVPATAEAYARRGFDHMELVSRELSALLGLPVADVLARAPAADQRSLGREGRAANLAGSVVVLDDVAGMRLLLADDVVTTGASMRTCAQALRSRGAGLVVGVAAARVW
jgi:ComF family protein